MAFNTLNFQQLHTVLCIWVGSLHHIRRRLFLILPLFHWSFPSNNGKWQESESGSCSRRVSTDNYAKVSQRTTTVEDCFARAKIHITHFQCKHVPSVNDIRHDVQRSTFRPLLVKRREPATVDCNTLCDSSTGTKYDNKINFFITRTCFSFDRNYFMLLLSLFVLSHRIAFSLRVQFSFSSHT